MLCPPVLKKIAMTRTAKKQTWTFWQQSKVLNLRVSRSLHTHTPPEGGVSQMVAYRLLQVEVPEDTKR